VITCGKRPENAPAGTPAIERSNKEKTMKKILVSNRPLLAVLVLALSVSCGDEDPAAPAGGGGIGGGDDPVVEITANITSPRTFSGDSVYVIKKYDFYVMAMLNIQPGAVIKFHPSEGPYCVLGSGGTINAVGTEQDPVVFTSYKDDAHGGDTNGDGDATGPAPRDWGEINTNSYNGSTFDYCHFYYGGDVNYNATLTVYGNNIQVSNCRFVNNDGSYASAAGDVGVLDASDAGANTTISNNVFYNNVRPLSISLEFNMISSNVFHNPDNPSETNTYNGIFVETTDDLDSNRQWAEEEVAFVIDDNDFWIESGHRLILNPNVVVKFKSGSTMVLADGAASIEQYSGVYFTSYRDDTHKGDTNGDGPSTGAPGDWGGIYDDSMSIPSPYYFTWANILFDSY
jgi:hypothetical protein